VPARVQADGGVPAACTGHANSTPPMPSSRTGSDTQPQPTVGGGSSVRQQTDLEQELVQGELFNATGQSL